MEAILKNRNEILKNSVELYVEIKNSGKKPIRLPQYLYWGFMKTDKFSDLVVEVMKKKSDLTFEPVLIINKFSYMYVEPILEILKPNKIKTSHFNIAAATEDSFFPPSIYKCRVRFNGKRYGLSKAIYSNWVEFEIK